MKLGITLSFTHFALWPELAANADELGFESAWIPDHLILPLALLDEHEPGSESNQLHPETPVYDCAATLGYLAARTERIRLGTLIYLYGTRHPFVSARSFATLDRLSGGRVELGVGAGWMKAEHEAGEIDFRSRGRRLDEALVVSRKLWTDPVVEHDGEFWRWPAVRFEPKPVQEGGPPIVVGGESPAALRRAARYGDGWVGFVHDSLDTLKPLIEGLDRACEEAGREQRPTVTVISHQPPPPDRLEQWSAAGVDRVIVRPWSRTSEALEGLRAFASDYAAFLGG